MTPDKLARLVHHDATQGFRPIREAVVWSQRELGVGLSESQMRRLFRRLGFRRKVPRPMAVGADAAVQAQWKKGGLARR